MYFSFFLCLCDGDSRDLTVLTPSCPTRLSSDLKPSERGRDRRSSKAWGDLRPTSPKSSRCPRQERYRSSCRQAACRCSRRQRQTRQKDRDAPGQTPRSEEHTSELQSLMRISYAVFCLKKKKKPTKYKPKS